MTKKLKPSSGDNTIEDFLRGKSEHTIGLYNHFLKQFNKIGKVTAHPAKTMIGIATPRKRIVYVTQLGKNFVHIVFPFEIRYEDNLCFQRIAQVPCDTQVNHHFRMYEEDDVNDEVIKFMKLAYQLGS